jgi:uncharacterized protein YcaQ
MTETTYPIDIARLMLLSTQGVVHAPAQPAQKMDVLEAIRRMGALQIDTIHVVARSPYFVLFSRLGDYRPEWLDELLAEGRLFEYWSHAASFLPIEDYPVYVSRMEHYTHRYYTAAWGEKYQDTVTRIMQRVRENGAVRSADFERSDGKKGSWWDWKEEKRVLEYLHTVGELMIARREKFQRVYDLRERLLPGWDQSQALSLADAEDELTLRSVRILGATPARWIPDYFRLPKLGMPQRLKRLTEEGRLQEISVEGWKTPWYIHPENTNLLAQAVSGSIQPSYTTLLSPFDPLTWDRERTRTLFHFDYSLECYLPQPKRQWGYFTLPLLHRGALIGRLDAKAYRKEKIFEIRALYLEPDVRLDEEMIQDVSAAIQRCADWHKTPKVVIQRSQPEEFGALLMQNLQTNPVA